MRILVFLGFTLLFSHSATAQTVFPSGSSTRLHTQAELTREQTSAFRNFRRSGDFFGAMVVNTTSGHHYWTANHHTIQMALQHALIGCREFSRTDGANADTCVLYASIVATGIGGNTSPADGLGREASQEFRTGYAREQVPGRWGAFAVSGLSEYGYSFGWDTQSDAERSAISACQAEVASTMADFNTAGRSEARRLGVDKCRLVHVAVPQ